jgi:hypothetical protein
MSRALIATVLVSWLLAACNTTEGPGPGGTGGATGSGGSAGATSSGGRGGAGGSAGRGGAGGAGAAAGSGGSAGASGGSSAGSGPGTGGAAGNAGNAGAGGNAGAAGNAGNAGNAGAAGSAGGSDGGGADAPASKDAPAGDGAPGDSGPATDLRPGILSEGADYPGRPEVRICPKEWTHEQCCEFLCRCLTEICSDAPKATRGVPTCKTWCPKLSNMAMRCHVYHCFESVSTGGRKDHDSHCGHAADQVPGGMCRPFVYE